MGNTTRFGSEKTHRMCVYMCVACVHIEPHPFTRLRCQTQKTTLLLLIKNQSQLSRLILPNTRWVFFSFFPPPLNLSFLPPISYFEYRFLRIFFGCAFNNWRLIYLFIFFKYDIICRALLGNLLLACSRYCSRCHQKNHRIVCWGYKSGWPLHGGR